MHVRKKKIYIYIYIPKPKPMSKITYQQIQQKKIKSWWMKQIKRGNDGEAEKEKGIGWRIWVFWEEEGGFEFCVWENWEDLRLIFYLFIYYYYFFLFKYVWEIWEDLRDSDMRFGGGGGEE